MEIYSLRLVLTRVELPTIPTVFCAAMGGFAHGVTSRIIFNSRLQFSVVHLIKSIKTSHLLVTFFPLFVRSFIDSLINSFIHPSIHPLTLSSFNHSFIIHLFVYSFVRLIAPSFISLLIDSLLYSFIQYIEQLI